MFTDIDSTAQAEGFTLTATIERDNYCDTPWDNEDGHGPVSDWTRRDKRPGELVLCTDRSRKRFYDFAEACQIARRDGWGYLPGKLETGTNPDGSHWARCGDITRHGADINTPIREVYAAWRETMTARQYATAAAMADFDRLRAWCNDQWSYVGVCVTASRNGIELGHASLWWIASDSGDYLLDVANELAAEAISEARDAIKHLTTATA